MRPLRFVHPYFLFAALFIPSNVPAGEACREFPKPFPGTLRAPVSYNLYECIRFQRPFPFNLKRTPAPATFFFSSYNRNTVRLVNLCTTEKIGEAVACFKIFKRQGRSRTRYSKKKGKERHLNPFLTISRIQSRIDREIAVLDFVLFSVFRVPFGSNKFATGPSYLSLHTFWASK